MIFTKIFFPIKLPTLALVMLSLFSFTSLTLSHNSYAQAVEESKKATQKRKAKKVPAMRNRVYTQLARAQKLADEGDKIAGFDVLDEVKDQLDNLNSYEKAMLWNFYGFMYYSNDDIDNAIDSFEQVIAQEAIPNSLYLSTLYSLAQLAMQQQNYKQALKFLVQWQQENNKPLTADQQMLFAQIYYQDKQYTSALRYVNQAIDTVEQKNALPKENWLILQRAAYYELKQPKKVTQVLEKMVRLYDKPQYWLQLAAMYGEIGEEAKQLAVMEAAYQAGYVKKESDIVMLAQLYSYHGTPFKSAKLLSSMLDKGIIKPTENNLNLLAQAYLLAKNEQKAIPILKQLTIIAEHGKYDAQLAQTYLNQEQWQQAIDAANAAIKRNGLEQLGNMYLVKGMAYFNLLKFDQALTAFNHALASKQSKKIAQQWLKYVEREKSYQQRIAMK